MQGKVLWLTGLSGSGKSTIAHQSCELLLKSKYNVKILDGDYIRNTLHKTLKFTPEDITENNRRTAIICKNMLDQYNYLIVPIISPFKKSRLEVSNIIGPNYVEIYVKAKLDTVIERDTKGFYKKAINGKINLFIGIDPRVPYEPPDNPNLVLDTDLLSPEKCVKKLIKYLGNDKKNINKL